MKYRIEDGEAKIPLSELNRLNDLFAENEFRKEQLDERERKLKEYKKEIDKKISDNTHVVIKTINPFGHMSSVKSHYVVTIDETIETLKDYKESITEEDVNEASNNIKKHFSSMSTRDFKKWKKEYNNG